MAWNHGSFKYPMYLLLFILTGYRRNWRAYRHVLIYHDQVIISFQGLFPNCHVLYTHPMLCFSKNDILNTKSGQFSRLSAAASTVSNSGKTFLTVRNLGLLWRKKTRSFWAQSNFEINPLSKRPSNQSTIHLINHLFNLPTVHPTWHPNGKHGVLPVPTGSLGKFGSSISMEDWC